MPEVESIIFRMEFTDPNYAPDAVGMDSICRIVNDIFQKGGVLVLPEKITTEWLKEKWTETVNKRKGSGNFVDFKILGALKAITVERVRLEFPTQKENKK